MPMSDADLPVTVTYSQPRWRPEWAVPEVPVPESNLHDLCIEFVRALLQAWAERENRNVLVARNLGIRWYESEPRAGFDPDVCVIEPPPPGGPPTSLRLWEAGHEPPCLAIEIVSPGHPYKDYLDTPARCAACGVRELWVYDPTLAGPSSSGGPFALQVWTRQGETMTRVHASNAPGYSSALDAWLVPDLHPTTAKKRQRVTAEGRVITADPHDTRLRISTAEVGGAYWPTLEEQHVRAERVRAERERTYVERERDALARELETLRKKER